MLQQFLEKSSQEWQKMKPGLERIQTACDTLGNPEKKIKTIHIAGTNGKGSVAAMLQSILSEAGLRVGLFTSPHLVKVNERFRIGDQEISDEELEVFLEKAQDLELSFFELCTLIAFLYFEEQKVDLAILETGLGGRLDATNVVTPIISIITEIGLDHTTILGSDIASIAREKAGIIKEGVPVVCGTQNPDARKMIEKVARKKNAPFYLVEDEWKGALALEGSHQIRNSGIVLKAIQVLNLQIQKSSIQKGFAHVRWPGRMEWISKDPPILLDGAHNLDGMRALVESLKVLESLKKWRILFSAASDKQINEMLSCLQEIASEIVICKMKNSRSMDPENFPLFKSSSDPLQAFHQMKESLGENTGILITGSLYFIGEMKSHLPELNPTTQ